MSVTFDLAGFSSRLSDRVARRLLAVGLAFQAECRRDLSVGNPAPHTSPAPKGDHPRLRTGNLRAQVALETTDLAQIASEKRLRVGVRKAAEYGFLLKRRGWLGIVDTLARCRLQLAAILTTGKKGPP